MKRWIDLLVVILLLIPGAISFGEIHSINPPGWISTSAKQSEIIIPVDLSLNRPVIALFINQQGPYSFIFDTGAGGNVIDQALASRLGLEETGKVELGSPGSDKTESAPLVSVPEIEISGQSFSDLSMVVMDLRAMIPVDGIVSFKQFAEYLVTIDCPERKIVLKEGALREDWKNVLALYENEPILTVSLEAGGQVWKAHLDTGSPFSFAFPCVHKDRLTFKSPPVLLAGSSRTVSGMHRNWKAELDGNIKLGGIVYDAPQIILSERHNEYVNIGYQTLKDLSITIDQQNMLIQFAKIVADDAAVEEPHENDTKGIAGRYGGLRSITLEDDQYYIQRDGSIKLKLVEVEDNLYEGKLPAGMRARNALPKIRFERDDGCRIIGLTFVFPDGREEFVKKDEEAKNQ